MNFKSLILRKSSSDSIRYDLHLGSNAKRRYLSKELDSHITVNKTMNLQNSTYLLKYLRILD